MGNSQKHIQQWQHNRKLVSLIPTTHPDWMVTVTFYVALHIVDALLEFDGVEGVNSHETRNKVLIRTNRYQKIWDHYQPLHDLCRRIRYLAQPNQWITLDDIPTQVFGEFLYPIEKSVHGLMGITHNLDRIKIQVPVAPSPPQK